MSTLFSSSMWNLLSFS